MPQTATTATPRNAAGQTRAEWLSHLARIGEGHGFFERLGRDHLALFVQEGDTLVVSFDRGARVYGEADGGLPLGFEAVQKRQWSLLSIIGLRDSWFRDADLFTFFDSLDDQGFFDSFDQVIFLGFGAMCGHAACAYSAAAPGASVLATNPAATLAPDRAGFDRRFRRARGLDFSRYGDAPALIDAAERAVILYDPADAPSSAHAAQFRAGHVTRAPLRFAGPDLHRMLETGESVMPMLRALANGRLTRARVAGLVRPARRSHGPYLWRLAQLAQRDGQFDRALRIADHAAAVTGEDRFSRLADQLDPRVQPEDA